MNRLPTLSEYAAAPDITPVVRSLDQRNLLAVPTGIHSAYAFCSPPGADIYLPGGDQIQWDTEYRYLGVILSTSGDLLGVHEENLRRSSQRAANVLRRKRLWGCNRFLLTRDLWKAVHVPGLTFANAVLCLNVTTRQWLERGQREVGRMALGCHGRVAIEAIQGDLGWSTFEAREARSKATYEGRLRLMDDERWPRRLFRYASLTGTPTQWYRRLGNLKRKFGMAKPVVEDRMYKWAHAVKTQVCEEETEQHASPLRFHKTKAPIAIINPTKPSLWRDCHCMLT
ncbi:hypothetical protein HPB50_018395 [Hyalomma asiaticum]|uniref:Uncharacterized protein n=1 Tax=Hyalomma asiaticum TaxID=266040 RepID=A0ACB7SCB2_HYAAI|nr:hypothetical protein HPB50_018395 [Hyalomma asiaticum]